MLLLFKFFKFGGGFLDSNVTFNKKKWLDYSLFLIIIIVVFVVVIGHVIDRFVLVFQLSASCKLLSVLHHLYGRSLLDRFVIDEAHCVSQVNQT